MIGTVRSEQFGWIDAEHTEFWCFRLDFAFRYAAKYRRPDVECWLGSRTGVNVAADVEIEIVFRELTNRDHS